MQILSLSHRIYFHHYLTKLTIPNKLAISASTHNLVGIKLLFYHINEITFDITKLNMKSNNYTFYLIILKYK